MKLRAGSVIPASVGPAVGRLPVSICEAQRSGCLAGADVIPEALGFSALGVVGFAFVGKVGDFVALTDGLARFRASGCETGRHDTGRFVGKAAHDVVSV